MKIRAQNTALFSLAGCENNDNAGLARIQTLEEVERQHIQKVLEFCCGDMAAASRLLGVSISTLYRKRAVWRRG